MQDVVDPADRSLACGEVGDVSFQEVDTVNVLQIFPLAGDQTVEHSHLVAAMDELRDKVRPDETGAAGDEIMRHGISWWGTLRAAVPE